MTLTRLVLHNYMIHRDLAADFSGNLIALTGEMGHGKSTFVGAIQFCLTGEHPPWHRDDLLTWGETEGSAKLYFTQNGVECSVLRKLHNSEVVLKIGNEAFTGARNVEKAMTDRLGVDKDILKQIGFVQQYEIQNILFDDPGKRERSFQKLLGIGDANKIWTDLGPIIQSYSKSENFDASIEALRQVSNRLGQELDGVDGSLAVCRKAMALIPSRDGLNVEVERLVRIQSQLKILEDTRNTIQNYEFRVNGYVEKKISLEAKRKAIVDSLGCTPEEMETWVRSLQEKNAANKLALTNMQRFIGASEVDGICPLCGAEATHEQIEQHVSSEMLRLTKAAEASEKESREASEGYIKIKSELSRLDHELTSANSSIVSYGSAVDEAKRQEGNLLRDFASLGLTPEQFSDPDLKKKIDENIASVRTTLVQYDDLNKRIAMLQGEKNAKQQQLDQTTKMIDAKVKEKELSAPIAKKVDVLTNVRNWFHSSNGPRTMSMSAIKAMTGYVNEYLSELHSEIEVMPDNQGLSFAFDYIDGRPVSTPPPSTAKLSGGQKIELALAFRLAIYRYFGQKMGIMVLDEPTAHLSPAGIEYFGTLLKTVSTLARNMNLQIIMPTHEKEIMPYMDSEIHFA